MEQKESTETTHSHVISSDGIEDQSNQSKDSNADQQDLDPNQATEKHEDDIPEETAPVSKQDSYEKVTRKEIYVVCCIVVTEMCERLAYYSVIANMVLFCTSKLDLSSDQAAVVTLVFSGTVYIMPVFGGFIADEWTGKFNAIWGSGLIYILGLFLLPASAVNYKEWFDSPGDLSIKARKACFFSSLVLVAIGTGGIKANIGPFGAQQIEHRGIKAVQTYFNWFYWFINVGAIIAYTVVAYVQQEQGFDYGFLIPLGYMILAVAVFVAARSRYKDPGPQGSIFKTAVGICVESFSGLRKPSFKFASRSNGGRYEDRLVEGVKAVVRVMPIFALFVVYWAVYSQMSTSLFLQSERMKLTFGRMRLPAALQQTFNTICIIILIPILDRIVYPFLEKWGRNPSNLQRIGIGMILAACSMFYSGILEIERKNNILIHGYIQQTLSGDTFNASQINMFAQIPEFALIGGLEFAYTQAPGSMQGLIMGIFLLTSGLGRYLASLLVAIVKSWKTSDDSDWFPAELNDGHMEYMLFLLAVLTLFNLVLFLVVTRWYKRKKLQLLENMEGDLEI